MVLCVMCMRLYLMQRESTRLICVVIRISELFFSCSSQRQRVWLIVVLGTTQARLGHQELEQGISRVVKLLACETKTHKQKLIQQHKVLKQVQTMQKISKVLSPYTLSKTNYPRPIISIFEPFEHQHT
jgi:hypothetical protein